MRGVRLLVLALTASALQALPPVAADDLRPSVASPAASPSPLPSAAEIERLRAEYGRSFARVESLAVLDAARKNLLERRIVLGARSLDADRLQREPGILVEKTRQAELDAAVIDADLGGGALPIVTTPGLRETILPGVERSAVAYEVPAGKVERMLVLLPGARETDSDLIARSAIERTAADTETLVVVPSLDGATSLAGVATHVADATASFENAFALPARRVYLGGVSNGASLQFEVPLLARLHYAGYLAIAGTFPGARASEILSILRADGDAIYFVAGGRDRDVPAAAVAASVSNCRSAGVFARYYEQKDAVNSIASLAPAIAAAWQDMVNGVQGAQDDGLGAMPGESRPV